MQQRKVLPRIINLAVFILLEIASLHVISRNAQLQQTWMARAAQGFKGKVWGGTEAVRSYFSLSKANRELARENFLLLQELSLAREQLRAAGLDTLDPGVREPGFSYLNAEVVKISRNKQHNYLVINRGYEDGVQEKSGIITREGVVGIVEAVSAHHSFAFSFQNNDISISARLGEEGGSGLLVWDGIHSNGATLKEIPLQFHYSPGDTVYTSGHSLFFPPDIPLGVTGTSRVVNGSTNEIAVTLFQDFSAVRYVTVVHNNSFDEIEEFQP
jgi:rod shape-determining protein MreC